MSRASAEPKPECLRCPRVVIEQSTKPLAPNTTDAPGRGRTVNQFVAQSVMVPFAMIMGHKLGRRATEMVLSKWNQSIQTLFFDRADEAFGERVRIRRPIRRLDDPQPGVL
jgi:hypothetical protein